MLELIAVAPEDGWAFVRKDDRVWLIKPPYTVNAKIEVSGRAVDKALSDHGFHAAEGTFDGWRKLVIFLEQQVVANSPEPLPTADKVRRLLRHAPAKVVEMYLDRIESELIPHWEWDGAFLLLSEITALDTLRDSPHVHQRTAELLKKWGEEKARAEMDRRTITHDLEALAAELPHLAKKGAIDAVDQLASKIAVEGQILKLGSESN